MIYECNECSDLREPCRVEIHYLSDSMEDKTLCVVSGQTGEGNFKVVE